MIFRTTRDLNLRTGTKNHAFSLVELSIVLVILGLLVGGVLSGQSLIHAAELRTVSSDFTKYKTAMYTFRDKYFSMPGSFSKASAFWPGAQNGNGSGNFGIWNSGTYAYAWQHLALSGLIEGQYTGSLAGTEAQYGMCTPQTECPPARINNLEYVTITSNSWYSLPVLNGILLYNGMEDPDFPTTGLTPEDAWNLDTKMDDGTPATGSFIAFAGGGFGIAIGASGVAPWAKCTTDGTGAAYALNLTTPSCSTFFVTQ